MDYFEYERHKRSWLTRLLQSVEARVVRGLTDRREQDRPMSRVFQVDIPPGGVGGERGVSCQWMTLMRNTSTEGRSIQTGEENRTHFKGHLYIWYIYCF